MLESSEARVAAASGDPVAALDPLDLLDPLDPVEKATLEVARAIEATDFGAWLREHLVLWNVIAVVALFALGFALALLLRLLFGTLIARALERANRHRTAAAIVESRLVAPLSAIVPLLIVARVLGILGESGIVHPLVAYNVANVVVAIAILRGLSVASRALRIVDDLYSSRPEVHRPEALRGYRQVAMVVLGLVAGISAAAIAVGKSPLVFLAALGAAGAVAGVVFKDVLLSLVANLMLTANDAIRIGDWVELKAHGIDGRIAEIRTTSVRVQNADGTVHSVPISRFVQEPYLNYRSRFGSPGRRIRRSIRVDARTVRALTDEERGRLATSDLPQSVVRRATAPGTPTTNLCIYRAFAEALLSAHPAVDPGLPVVVAQQESTPSGQPVDLLCFLRADPAADLVALEGEILDRLAMALSAFGLRSYQSGSDLGPSPGPFPVLAEADQAAVRLDGVG